MATITLLFSTVEQADGFIKGIEIANGSALTMSYFTLGDTPTVTLIDADANEDQTRDLRTLHEIVDTAQTFPMNRTRRPSAEAVVSMFARENLVRDHGVPDNETVLDRAEEWIAEQMAEPVPLSTTREELRAEVCRVLGDVLADPARFNKSWNGRKLAKLADAVNVHQQLKRQAPQPA